MNYTLMHKNIKVVELMIAEAAVAITDIGKIYNPEHIPLGVPDLKGRVDIGKINDWLRSRSIPASRSGVRDFYTRLGRNSTDFLILKGYGLSLSDYYWIRPAGSGLAWADINFFQNDFSRDVGEMLFGRDPADMKHIVLISPDNTTDGWLRKKWVVAGGKRMLIKGGSGPWKQEPFNEVIAGAVMRRLGIAHVPYSLVFEDCEPYCVCENFLSADTELIPAWYVFHSKVMSDGDSDYTHFLRCCEKLAIPNAYTSIDQILTLDYIIANEDRHYNNFGFVRNPETLAWLGSAPIYDCGASLWHNTLDVGEPGKCQPFEKTHEEQIKLVSNFNWFKAEEPEGLEREITGIFSKSRAIDENRAKTIAEAVVSRIDMIKKAGAVMAK